MCEVVEQFANERVLNLLFKEVQDGAYKLAYAAKQVNLSQDEFKEQMTLRGYTTHQRKSRSTARKVEGEL